MSFHTKKAATAAAAAAAKDHDSDVSSYTSGETIVTTTPSKFSIRSRKMIGVGIWFRWASTKDFILFNTICTINTWGYEVLLRHVNKQVEPHPTVLHFLLIFIVVCLPVMYMMVSIGQYTQRGLISIKDMCPIVHGTAYTSLLNIFANCLDMGISMSIIIIYLLMSFNSNLQWLLCPPATRDVCWNSKTNCTNECLERYTPSAKMFYLASHLGIGKYKVSNDAFTWMIKKFLPLATCWVVVIVFLAYTRVSCRKLITILLICSSVTFVIVFTGCMLTQGGIQFTTDIIKITWMQFVSPEAWAIAFHESFQFLNIGRSLHAVTGTFLAPKAHAGILSLCETMLVFSIMIIMNCLALSSYGILRKFSHSNDTTMQNFWLFTQEDAVFSIIPQSFDFMSVPQFWSFAFYTTCLLSEMNCLVLNIILLEKSFSDANPKLQRYKLYTTLVITTMVFFASMIISRNQESYANFANVVLAAEISEMINISLIVTAICVLYGVQKLCDDIHFLTGNAPSKFWKIAWYIMPLFYIVLTGYSINYHMNSSLRSGNMPSTKVVLISLGGFLSPIFLFAVIKVWQYMKKKNLVGLFKATELYGPGDPEDRYLRKIHNPRTEIRSKRKTESCAHRCFLENRAFRKAVQDDLRE